MAAAFPDEEYRERLGALRRLMAGAGIDVLIVLSEANICYLTGYEGYSDHVPQAAVVTLGDDPWLILREMDVACAVATCWLPDERLVGYSERYIGSSDRSPWQPIGEFAASRSPRGALGCEMSAGGFGPKQHAALLSALGGRALIDGDGLVARCKRVKSASELAYIEQASSIVDRAMGVGSGMVRGGVRQADVAAAVMHALVAGTETHPGGPPRPPTMPVGRIANAPHLKWTDASYSDGQQTNFELAAFRHRYACALSRTVFVGKPSARLTHVHRACLVGFEAAFAAIRPGTTSGHVDAAFRSAFAPFGIRKESRIGYSIGIDWPDGGATIQPGDKSVLENGMVLHLIIGIWERTEGYVLSETVNVTATGVRSLTKVPRELISGAA